MGFKNHFVHTKVGKCKIILHKIIFFIVLITMCIFLDYRCSNSNDRASQVVICYLMTDFKIYISVYSITYSTHIHLVQQVTGPRITPVKSNLDQSKVQWSK